MVFMRGLWFGSSADALYSLGYMCVMGCQAISPICKNSQKSNPSHVSAFIAHLHNPKAIPDYSFSSILIIKLIFMKSRM